MYAKNDKIQTLVTDMTSTGEGVSKADGMTVFTEGAVPGDKITSKIVAVKPNYLKSELISIDEESEDRRKDQAVCPYQKQCGGCPFFDIDYSAQLRLKEKQVRDALERIGGFENPPVEPIVGAAEPFFYRNKAQYKVGPDGLGFYAKGSHDVVPTATCLTQPKNSGRIISLINSIIKKNKLSLYDEKTHKGLLRGIIQRTNREGKTMIVFVVNAKRMPEERAIADKLLKDSDIVSVYVNVNKAKGNRILGAENRLIGGEEYLTEKLGGRTFQISPSSFFQVNTAQTEVLYGIVKEYADLKSGEEVYDLYCGTGTIGIYIADDGIKLTGIEINPESVEDAKTNAELNGLTDAEFLAGKAEVVVPEAGGEPDCVILDPPRKGCDRSLLELLLEMKTPRIVYVSCNPTTLARDLKILAGDYTIEKVQPVDLFPQTGHVECVVLMSRAKE